MPVFEKMLLPSACMCFECQLYGSKPGNKLLVHSHDWHAIESAAREQCANTRKPWYKPKMMI